MGDENDKKVEELLSYFHNHHSSSTTPSSSSREVEGYKASTNSLVGSFLDVLNKLPIYGEYSAKFLTKVSLEEFNFFCQSDICLDESIKVDSFQNLNIFRQEGPYFETDGKDFDGKTLKESRPLIFKHLIYTLQYYAIYNHLCQNEYASKLADLIQIILLRLLKEPNWSSCLTDADSNSGVTSSILTCELVDALPLQSCLNEFVWKKSDFKLELASFLSKFLTIVGEGGYHEDSYRCEMCGDNWRNCASCGKVTSTSPVQMIEEKKKEKEEEKTRFNFSGCGYGDPDQYAQHLLSQSYLIGRYIDPCEIDLIKPLSLLTREELDIRIHLPDGYDHAIVNIEKLAQEFEKGRREYLREKEQYITNVGNLLNSCNFLLPPLTKLVAEVAW